MSHGEIERFKPIDWDDTGFYLKIAHLFRKNQPLKPAATVLYGVLGPVDVLKGHIIRRSQLFERVFPKHQTRGGGSRNCTKEPQDMMVGVRFTYSADHFEGWRLGILNHFFFGLQTVKGRFPEFDDL